MVWFTCWEYEKYASSRCFTLCHCSFSDEAFILGLMIRNDFNQYIEKYIEGYLFADLKTIHENVSKDGSHQSSLGNLAYIFTTAMCSAMEFLGLLLREKDVVKDGRIDASNALAHYIKYYLEPIDPKYSVLRAIGSQLVRNGITHTYATKGNIAITRQGTREQTHFVKYGSEGVIVLNPDYIYEDFLKSYEVVKSKLATEKDLLARVEEHYNTIKAVYASEVGSLDTKSIMGAEWKDKTSGIAAVDIIDSIEVNGDLVFVS